MKNKEFILSPSSLNLFIKDQALWVMKHYFGLTGGGNIFTIRGKLVEDYVNMCLTAGRDTISFDEYVKKCKEKSTSNKVLNMEGIEKPYLIIDGIAITKQDLEGFYKWGKHAYTCLWEPENIGGQQEYVETELEGIKLGGYIDYRYDTHVEMIIDLKTCTKLPTIVSRGERKGMISKTKVDNIRQQVIYEMATVLPIVLLYVTPTEHLSYQITKRDIDEVIPSITEGIKKIKNLLTMGKDYAILNTQPGKMGNPFLWGDKLKLKAKEIWNL